MAGLVPREDQTNKDRKGTTRHQCIPLYTLLLAINNNNNNSNDINNTINSTIPTINYFSLDVEGAELEVLRTIPWHLVRIEVNRSLDIYIDIDCYGLTNIICWLSIIKKSILLNND